MDCFSYYNNNSSANSSITSSVETFIKHRKGNTNGKKKPPKELKLSTDPQSVAARERRHRISDRFKILQSLVPGGAKMDTVSMLDEAIHYVKFLKAQIWLHQTLMTNFVDDVNVIDPSLSVSGQQGGLYSPENMVGGEVEMAPSFGLPEFYFQGGESKVFDCPMKN